MEGLWVPGFELFADPGLARLAFEIDDFDSTPPTSVELAGTPATDLATDLVDTVVTDVVAALVTG